MLHVKRACFCSQTQVVWTWITVFCAVSPLFSSLLPSSLLVLCESVWVLAFSGLWGGKRKQTKRRLWLLTLKIISPGSQSWLPSSLWQTNTFFLWKSVNVGQEGVLALAWPPSCSLRSHSLLALLWPALPACRVADWFHCDLASFLLKPVQLLSAPPWPIPFALCFFPHLGSVTSSYVHLT